MGGPFAEVVETPVVETVVGPNGVVTEVLGAVPTTVSGAYTPYYSSAMPRTTVLGSSAYSPSYSTGITYSSGYTLPRSYSGYSTAPVTTYAPGVTTAPTYARNAASRIATTALPATTTLPRTTAYAPTTSLSAFAPSMPTTVVSGGLSCTRST